MDVEQLTEWPWCLRTPVVQAYAVRDREGFDLIDMSTAGQEDAILDALVPSCIARVLESGRKSSPRHP